MWARGEEEAASLRHRRYLLITLAVLAVSLAASVPLQYLVRKEVVVGLPSDAAHSHAHAAEEEHGEEDAEEAREHT